MKEIVSRLTENRQVELAKSILESAGYKVRKKLRESGAPAIRGDKLSNSEAIKGFQDELDNPEKYGYDEYPEYLEIAKTIINILKKDPNAIFYSGFSGDYDMDRGNMIIDTGNDYFCKGVVYDEEGNEYKGYFAGNRDGMMNFLLTSTSISDSKEVNESVDEEYKESVEEFFSHLHKAFEILKNTEEGVLESIVKDDELYDRLQDYIYNLDTAILSNYKKD